MDTSQVRSQFTAHFAHQAALAKSHYEQVRGYHGVDAVHDFRVAVKRLWALVDVLEWVDSRFPGRGLLRPVRRLFQACGPLRDVQVQQELVRTSTDGLLPGLSEYYNHLKQRERQARRKFERKARGKPILPIGPSRGAVEPFLAEIPENILLFRMEQYLSDAVGQLVNESRLDPSDAKALHKIRIETKRTRYALEVLAVCRPDVSGGLLKALNMALREVHRALGVWHDSDVALASLHDFRAGYEHRELFNPPAYAEFAERLKRARAEALNAFRERWAALYQHLAVLPKSAD